MGANLTTNETIYATVETARFLSGTTCLTQCPDGFYGNSSEHVCASCNASLCQNCIGPLEDDCTSCASPKFLYLNINNKKQCLEACPVGMYGEPTTRECALCNAACVTCAAASIDDCGSCSDGYFLFNKSCLYDSCPSGHYKQGPPHNLCQSCDQTCAECSGPS